MHLRKMAIGTLLGAGMTAIIILLVSVPLYSNYLTSKAQQIIDTSTRRIFQILTIQRDTDELFSTFDDLVMINDEREFEDAKRKIAHLTERAEESLRDGKEEGILNEEEYAKIESIFLDVRESSDRFFTLRQNATGKIYYGGGSFYDNDPSRKVFELNAAIDKLRNTKYRVGEIVYSVISRSDLEFRGAMELVGRSQSGSWLVSLVSLMLALGLAYVLVRSAKKVFELKNEFINIIAHDLRNPVTAILGYLDILNTSEDISKEEKKKDLNVIQVSALRLRSLINNLLEVGRSETGRLSIDLGPVDISEVLAESVLRAEAIAITSGINIQYEKDDSLPKVIAEKNKLTDVIDNLISNALKYNREGGSVTISSERKEGRVTISVADTGLGISKEDAGKLFQKYSRVGKESKKRTGTGLGLYTAKMLVEKMGGTINFLSKEGKGTTFTVTLNTPALKK